MNPAVFSVPPNPMERLDALLDEVRREGREVFDLGIGDPREPTPDFIVQTLRDAIPAVSQYPRVAGAPALREAIARYVARRFGVTLDPATQILPTAGAKEGIFHLASCLVDPQGERRVVIHPDPGYPIYERGAVFAGAMPHAVPLTSANGFLIDLQTPARELCFARTAILWICSPNNPTGRWLRLPTCESSQPSPDRHGFVVASDECYADVYSDTRLPHFWRPAPLARSSSTPCRSGAG